MDTLGLALLLFLILETLNIATLYLAPGSRRGNGVGVFRAWERSKADPEVHAFVRYLVYWVAGTKLIFAALLVVILATGGPSTRLFAVVALIASIASFYWRLFPIARGIDAEGGLRPPGYARTLGRMIAGILGVLTLALIWTLVR